MEANPLATPQPRIDKVLSLIRKAMVINQSMSICIDVCWYAYTEDDNMVEFIVHPTKDHDLKTKSIFQPLLRLNAPELVFNEEYLQVKFVFNNLIQKGTFPKEIPSFSEYTAAQKRLAKLQKQTQK